MYLVLVVLAVASMFVVGNTTVDIDMHMYIYSVKLYARRKMITSSGTHQSKQKPLHNYHSTSANTHRLLAQLMDPAYQLMHHYGKADYLCRKGYQSIVLQAVVDCHIKFHNVHGNLSNYTEK